MSAHTLAQTPVQVAARAQPSVLQRACACGQHTHGEGECAECKKKGQLQHKLAVGASNDPFEQEADRVARQVLGGLPQAPVNPGPLSIRRLSGGTGGPAGAAPPSVDRALAQPGAPLPSVLASDMGRRFGHDFSGVRLHTDPAAERSAREVSALAYTVGNDIVFGRGQFSPETSTGRRLLAHELTHVVQQTGGADSWRVQRSTVLSSTIDMHRRVLKGEHVFHVSDGGVVVTATAGWEPSKEWQGESGTRPKCPGSEYHVTLTKKNMLLDDEYGTCPFPMGGAVSRQWTELPEGDYYLRIWLDDWDPNCHLYGGIEISQERGLTGDTCTKAPPGPLEMLHDGLAMAGMIPFLGAIPDTVDAGIYAIEGNWKGAGLSAAAAIPFLGDGASLIRSGEKLAVRVEGKAIKKLGAHEIGEGLKVAKNATKTLKQPTYKALRSAAEIDERLLELALAHRTQLYQAGEKFGSHNVAVIKALVDGKVTYMSARSTVRELHSEARLIQQVDEMAAKGRKIEVLQIYSERIPCTRAGCMQAINAKYPKADVFYSVSDELAESAGSRADALQIVYGLKP